MSEGFLGRWSRRKQEVREAAVPEKLVPEVVPTPVPVPVSEAASADPNLLAKAEGEKPPVLTLADVEGLGIDSDFKPFLTKEVAP
jgi:hypothetical protein